MTLDSTVACTKAQEGKQCSGLGNNALPNPKDKECTVFKPKDELWHYLFVHHAKAEKVNTKLKEKFHTFIHREVVYTHTNRHVRQSTSATIPGLLFVQGRHEEIQQSLNECFGSLYLAKDCATGKVADIADSIMQVFMRIAQVDSARISFLPHALNHYATGNALIRITSGILNGLEGYRIRIARDRCLVTSIGGICIAIGGIHKDSFENVDEYVRQRKNGRDIAPTDSSASLIERIKAFFFQAKNGLDLMAIASKCTRFAESINVLHENGSSREAAETAIYLLEEMGANYPMSCHDPRSIASKELIKVAHCIGHTLQEIKASLDTSDELKNFVESSLSVLHMRFPFLRLNNK